ncbi:MAG: fumarylacetoacetate hydrolase family protein [Rhodospirillales bacterium]|nr:fumarylacetoacetate hydrolase family protein [Rhodospirillales bacterium]
MEQFIIPAPSRITLGVNNTDKVFPVRRIYCVGRNYADHIREMGNDERDPPFFFQKPADAILPSGSDFPYPPLSEDVHHEIELVVAIGKGGTSITQASALDHVFGYGVGIDMTRRDLQADAKEMRRPWEIGKAFDHAAPCSLISPATEIGHPDKGRIWLSINGTIKQDGDLAQQIWGVPETIWHLSQSVTLVPGDLIMTGTPAGVGPIRRSDVISGGIENVGDIEIRVV